MINKKCAAGLIALVLLIICLYDSYADCCGQAGQEKCYAGGKCCANVWYIGCYSTAQTFCPDQPPDISGVLGCLVCRCASPTSCGWEVGSDICIVGNDTQCNYDSLDLPSTSSCVLPTPTPGDSDGDGVLDESDECPGTILLATMDEDALGCSVEQAEALPEGADVIGLSFNVFAFVLAFLALAFLIVYSSVRRV